MAEDFRIVAVDYKRRYITENRVLLFKGHFVDDKTGYQSIVRENLNDWMYNSPVETLLRLRRRFSSGSEHPLINFAKSCADKMGSSNNPDKT